MCFSAKPPAPPPPPPAPTPPPMAAPQAPTLPTESGSAAANPRAAAQARRKLRIDLAPSAGRSGLNIPM